MTPDFQTSAYPTLAGANGPPNKVTAANAQDRTSRFVIPVSADKPNVSDPHSTLSPQPLVSNAVAATLLHLQDTGTVFGDKDSSLMNIRGVTDQERQRFAEIVQHAASTGGFENPVDYIQSLSSQDIEVLRRVHSLAEPSGVRNSGVEGAVNLLLPPQNHTDLNNDGLVETGAAVGFVFPPPNAPQSVKDAWEETTKDMSSDERLLASAHFLGASISANIKFDSNGTAIGIYHHTDPEYTNIYGTTEGEWETLLSQLVEESKKAESRDPSFRERTKLLTEFSEFSRLNEVLLPEKRARVANQHSAGHDELVGGIWSSGLRS